MSLDVRLPWAGSDDVTIPGGDPGVNGAGDMKDSAAYQASAGQQTVETTVGAHVAAGTSADQPRSKAKAASAAPG